MILHFVSTAEEFDYSDYLAVLTALKVHSVSHAVVWATVIPKDNLFFEKVQEIATVKQVAAPRIPNFDWYDDWQKPCLMADLLRWEKLYEHGGLYLDLDTVSISDITFLLGNREVLVGHEYSNDGHSLDAACVLATPASDVIKFTLDTAKEKLEHAWKVVLFTPRRPKIMFKRQTLQWASTAPGALFDAYRKFGDQKMRVESSSFSGYCCPYDDAMGNRTVFDENLILSENIKVLHCWRSITRSMLKNVTPQWIIDSNCLYAVAVKSVLSEKELIIE